MTAAIHARDLAKTYRVARRHGGFLGPLRNVFGAEYREVVAVAGVTFAIGPGELVGYVGPNGAGKSTTIKMLTGILLPSAGSIEVLGMSPERERKRIAQRIGVVFGQRTQLWWDLPLIESFELLRHMYRVSEVAYRRRVEQLDALLGLGEFLATPVRQLSLGQRMRGDLAAALLHEPEILFLDEPTIGLDVVAKYRVREFLRAINRDLGVTILLTTHDMTDIEQLCRRMMIIDRGALLFDGALADILERFGGERTLVIDLATDELAEPLDVPDAIEVRRDGPRRWLRFQRAETSASAVISAVAARYPIADLTIEEPDIESIVRRIYQEGIERPASARPS